VREDGVQFFAAPSMRLDLCSMSTGKPTSAEPRPGDQVEKIPGPSAGTVDGRDAAAHAPEPTADTSPNRTGADSASDSGFVDEEDGSEPRDPHPDTPDDLDDDVPLRESVESMQKEP
jgi:hypothetical protein